ncbi:MAG: hypothetical protein II779_05300 [Clostridia bacterium]|nr:hypothetical protein [Clostridia bacterium]
MRRLLKRWKNIETELSALYDAQKAICDEIDSVSDLRAQRLDGMPRGSESGRPVEQNAIRMMSLRERYRERLDLIGNQIRELNGIRDLIERGLLFCSPDEEHLLRRHYYDGASMETVAAELEISVRKAWYMERYAIEKMIEIAD